MTTKQKKDLIILFFVGMLVAFAIMVSIIAIIDPYNKGFEAGQKNVSNDSQSEVIYQMFRLLKELDMKCHQPICVYETLSEKEVIIIDTVTDSSLRIKNDGTWTASWRNNDN